MRFLLGSLVGYLVLQAPALALEERVGQERARDHYQAGVSLFESGNKEQALIEFQLANEIAPKPENVFMIAQCEYHLGKLVEARAHYRAYLSTQPAGELADLARLRIAAINRRPGIFAINTVPDDVSVRIEGEGTVVTGQAPNEFQVPHGRYRVTVSKPSFASESRDLAIEVAETRPLFFKLEPIPAHLVVRTSPAAAALFVRGNRTRNPYVQDVPPGTYEIYAEATYYQPKREAVTLAPGEVREVELPLTYVQRSGRPELIGSWTALGAVAGGLAVLTQTQTRPDSAPSGTIFGAGILAGGLTLGVLSSTTGLVPAYIRDNLALFRIGVMWTGGVEGASLAMGLSHEWTYTLLGSTGGVAAGAFTGWWLDDKAPYYGRVALVQSAALFGMAAGALMVPGTGSIRIPPPRSRGATSQGAINAYNDDTKERLALGVLAGLNVGLLAGLGMAYLPNQSHYGPTWQRVLMVDLAGLAGGLIASAVEYCTRKNSSGDYTHCAPGTSPPALPRKPASSTRRPPASLWAGPPLAWSRAGCSLPTSTGLARRVSRRLPCRFCPGLEWCRSVLPPAAMAWAPGLLSQGRF